MAQRIDTKRAGAHISMIGRELNFIVERFSQIYQAGPGLTGRALADAEEARTLARRVVVNAQALSDEIEIIIEQARRNHGEALEQREIHRATRVMLGDGKSKE